MIFSQKNNKQTTNISSTRTPVIVEGNIFFENIPIKNAVVELIAQEPNGQIIQRIAQTYSSFNGHFYTYNIIPSKLMDKNIGIRVCVYSTPGPNVKPFPLFFGSKTFSLSPQQRQYLLPDINLPLGLSFCERPLIFKGFVLSKHHNEFLYTQQKVRLIKHKKTVLAETSVDIDGSFHIYACADNILSIREELLLEASAPGCSRVTSVLIEPDQHAYQQDISLR